MTAMRIFLCSFLLCMSATSASRVSLRGRTVEDPCDPDDENYDPKDPACEEYDEDEEGPGEGEDKEDGGEEGPGDDEEGGPPGDDEEGGGKGEDDCQEWCPKCDEPDFPDYDPQDEECMSKKEEEEIYGDGEDNMAEEMTDVHDGPHFEEIDADGDEEITVDEAMSYGVAHGLSVDEVTDIFDHMDINKDKVVSREEFDHGPSQDATEDMAPDHSDMDLNGDGVIEWLEWEAGCVCGKSYLSTCGDEEFCKDIFHAADGDGDELVTKEEFNGAGEECKTADDGNCDLLALKKSTQVKMLALKKSAQVKKLRLSEYIKKFSMAAWVRTHFKRSGHNLFALAQLRHQHKKGIFIKLAVLIGKKHAHQTMQHKGKINQKHTFHQIRHAAKGEINQQHIHHVAKPRVLFTSHVHKAKRHGARKMFTSHVHKAKRHGAPDM